MTVARCAVFVLKRGCFSLRTNHGMLISLFSARIQIVKIAPQEKVKAKGLAGPPVVLAPRVHGPCRCRPPLPFYLRMSFVPLLHNVRLKFVGVWRSRWCSSSRSVRHSKEPGTVKRATRAYHQKLNTKKLSLLAVLGHGNALGYDGGYGGCCGKGAGVAPAAPPAWAPPAVGTAPRMPPGVWPSVPFGPPGAGCVGDCFARGACGCSWWRIKHGSSWRSSWWSWSSCGSC